MSRRINLNTLVLPDPQRCAWMEANGIDPSSVPAAQEVLVENGQITYVEFELDEDGNKILDESLECGFRKRLRAVPLLSTPEDHNL